MTAVAADASTVLGVEATEETVTLRGVDLHYVRAGRGPAVVLLHGFPATWFGWRDVLADLAADHTVIAPDLRGIGVERPPTSGFDKATMAADLAALLDHLDVDRAAIVGHDIGALVALAFARRHPARTTHLAFLDQGVPGRGLLEFALDLREPGRGFWHFAFHMADRLPELLIADREDTYFSLFWDDQAVHPATITADERSATVAAYRRPGALAAGLGWYRALRVDAEEFARDAPRLGVPVLALGGDHAAADLPVTSLPPFADDVRGGVVADCGHWVHLEQPAEFLRRLRELLARRAPTATTGGRS